MPMAILSMPEDTEVAVLEMGMNHFREIAYLTAIAQPDVAVITNIGTMHIEHLGSQQGILQAKLEILEGMGEGGKVLLNGDDPLLWNVHRQQSVQVTYFGLENPECCYLASDVKESGGKISFIAKAGDRNFEVELALEGLHYVNDAMAAVGVAAELGVAEDKIRSALAGFQNMSGRQEIFEAKGYTIIKDCYNAGPESMAAALAVLGNKTGRRVAVLGDMLELGMCTPAEHYRVGRIVAEKADLLLAYGPNSGRVVSGALTGGMSATMAKAFDNRDEVVAAMQRMMRPGDVILVKGSRGMRMELILDKFLKEA
jgi:UDP-N-acetylmuramoyl-tripeptide--D-alanyl-D-alanine ligase